MEVRVEIKGFGRIGSKIIREIVEQGRKEIKVVEIKDIGKVEKKENIMSYERVNGSLKKEVEVEGDKIDVG